MRTTITRSALVLLSMRLATSELSAQGYTDVGPQNGLDLLVPAASQYFDIGTGVSFHDFDGDGDDDLTFGNRNGTLKFFRNNGGALEPVELIGLSTGSAKAVLWADVDNDGDSDFLVTTFLGRVNLFHNNGDGSFTDMTAVAGFVPNVGKYWGASFGDYDRDGFLDLYVCTYIYESEAYTYAKINHLYHNDGDGTFTDVTIGSGTGNGMKASFQSMWMDVDQDGWQDIFVINDFLPGNALFRNNHDGTFTDVSVARGLFQGPEHCMSISMCDLDVDGDQDIFMTNTGIYPQVNNARQMLMVNDGTGHYTESSNQFGLDVFEWGWGGLWIDHDNDGYQDLYMGTHEHVVPVIPAKPDLFFKNQGGNSFIAAPELFNGDLVRHTHSVARGDLNGDGYADLVVHGQEPFAPQLWLNEGGTASHVRIGVQGTVSNRQGIGTWINVHAGGKHYTHYTVCGENYLGQSSHDVHFGLGEATIIDSVVVQYLSGHVDRYYDLPVDTLYRFTEGETFAPRITAASGLVVCRPATVELSVPGNGTVEWSTGESSPAIVIDSSGSYHATITNTFGITANTDTVDVIVGEMPEIIANVVDPTCAGEANGSIELVNLSGTPAELVSWATGQQGTSLTGLGEGELEFVFTDIHGCSASGSVILSDPDPVLAVILPEHAVTGADGALSWTIFGGVPPYVQTLNDEPVSGSSASGLEAGTYVLGITDAHGCSLVQAIELLLGVGMEDHNGLSLGAYPNPAQDHIQVITAEQWRTWRILDLNGRTLLAGGWVRNEPLDISALSSGTYMLELLDEAHGQIRVRFLKS
ncbi:MAG: FG-GAP-like repeat-containing protein [Flavobacteriales bacterium]